MNKVKRRPIRWIAWGDWLKAFPNCRMRNIETEFIWGQIFCTSMIMMIMTWSIVESKYFGFQKFRLTAMFLSHKIPFQIICKNWQGAKKFVFFSALGYLVFWGCNISPDSLKVVPVAPLYDSLVFLIHHSLPDLADWGPITTYNRLWTVWQCAGMGGGGGLLLNTPGWQKLQKFGLGQKL